MKFQFDDRPTGIRSTTKYFFTKMNIESIKKSLEESINKKQRFIKYLNEIDFFNSKISLTKLLKLIKEIDGFEIHYEYARQLVSREKELASKAGLKTQSKIKEQLNRPIETIPQNAETKTIISTLNNEVAVQKNNLNSETALRIQDLISMNIDDLPEELKRFSTVDIDGQTFDVRKLTPSDFKFFGNEDDPFNFAKNMEAKGFLKGSEEYKYEYAQDKLRSQRRKKYREANKEFNSVAKKFIT